MAKEEKTQRAFLVFQDDGSLACYGLAHGDLIFPNTMLVRVKPGFNYADVQDLRQPPFAQILPCPYCGVLEDKGHDLQLHINPSLGKDNATLR